MALTLAVDAMGGDVGLDVTVPAVALLLKKYPDINVLLVGHPEQTAQALSLIHI